jgi:hypothetical protein
MQDGSKERTAPPYEGEEIMATRKCKYGKLKCAVGKRVCKKKPRKAKASKSKACRYGKLKNPVGKRVCKKKPGGRKRR